MLKTKLQESLILSRGKALEASRVVNPDEERFDRLKEKVLTWFEEVKREVIDEIEEVKASVKNGADGEDGADGESITGSSGKDGESIIGPPGRDGKSIIGPPGKDGESIAGPPGKDGKSIIGPPGKDGAKGKDASPKDVTDKLNTFKEKVESELENIKKAIERSNKNKVGGGLSNAQKTILSGFTAYRAITALRTLDTTDYTINCTANTFTVTLPTAVGITGRIYVIKNSGTGVITVDGAGSETLDGTLTAVLSTQYESITIQSNGVNFIII